MIDFSTTATTDYETATSAASAFFDFCQAAICLQGQPIRFEDRPYLPAIYEACDRNVVLRASRQVEKSTYLVNRMIFEACIHPGRRILFVAPRQDQARAFCKTRLNPAIRQSPLVLKLLGYERPPQLGVDMLQFPNGSEVFLRAAYRSADATRGISADVLICDEFQDLADGDLPVLQETLSHSKLRTTILTGTPKLVTNHLETAFANSTARQWTVTCPGCGKPVIPDERSLGPEFSICHYCGGPIDFATGMWVATNPDSTWGEGFWINHLMVPWVTHRDLLNRRHEYDEMRLKNEVLGLPTSYGDITVTIAELEACCSARPMAREKSDIPSWGRARLMAGIDWGGNKSRTSVVIASLADGNVVHLWHWASIRRDQGDEQARREVAAICDCFGVRAVMADACGNGAVQNRLLAGLLGVDNGPRITGVQYGNTDDQARPDGILLHRQIHRSKWIGGLIGRIKEKMISFPCEPDSRELLTQIVCEQAEFDDQTRMVRYSHPDGQSDDLLHALVYLLAGAVAAHERSPQYET